MDLSTFSQSFASEVGHFSDVRELFLTSSVPTSRLGLSCRRVSRLVLCRMGGTTSTVTSSTTLKTS